MRRRRNARGEGNRLREEIVEAAAQLTDAGVDRLTLRAIANQVGVAAPSLYDHFSGVPAIRAALIRSCYAELTERIQRAQDQIGDPVGCFETTCTAYVSYGEQFPHRYGLLFRGERDEDELGAVRDSGAAALQTLVDSIAACQAAQRSPADDPYDAAIAVWTALHGLTTLRASRPHFAQLQTEAMLKRMIFDLARITRPQEADHED